jgi:hypothetical protein
VETEWRSLRFDGVALWNTMDELRAERGLSWREAVVEINSASEPEHFAVNHPIDVATVKRMKERGDCGCHFALGYLAWVDRTPESFLIGAAKGVPEEPLPIVGSDRRLRWDIPALADAVDERRAQLRLTRPALADLMGCSLSQVNLRAIRYGTGMSLTMRLSQWLGRSAASFVIGATW